MCQQFPKTIIITTIKGVLNVLAQEQWITLATRSTHSLLTTHKRVGHKNGACNQIIGTLGSPVTITEKITITIFITTESYTQMKNNNDNVALERCLNSHYNCLLFSGLDD